MKKALTVAGSDCSGGAGIQADLKTFAAHGVYGASVIVSVVAENTVRVIDAYDLTPDMIEKQMEAVFEDIFPDAVKVGMLSSAACMRAAAGGLKKYKPRNIVIDPVMIAKGGAPLMRPEAMGELIQTILPLADLLTPNIPEAEAILGETVGSVADMERAARGIARLGPKAVLVKGGHAEGEPVDVLFDGERIRRYRAERIDTKNTHGTGCTFSSAIAANLALGLPVGEAVGRAKEYVTEAIRHARNIGKGHGPTHHFYQFDGCFAEKEKRNEL